MNDEPELRRLMASQRSQERAHAPGLERLLARARRAPDRGDVRPVLWPRIAFASAAAAVALTLAIGTIRWPHYRHSSNASAASADELAREIDQTLASLKVQVPAQHALISWQSPTDFLLNQTLIDTP